jgi:hypothetical protein
MVSVLLVGGVDLFGQFFVLQQFLVDLVLTKDDSGCHVLLKSLDSLHEISLLQFLMDFVFQLFLFLLDLLLLLKLPPLVFLLLLLGFGQLFLHLRIDFLVDHYSFRLILAFKADAIVLQKLLFVLLCELGVVFLWEFLFATDFGVVCGLGLCALLGLSLIPVFTEVLRVKFGEVEAFLAVLGGHVALYFFFGVGCIDGIG